MNEVPALQLSRLFLVLSAFLLNGCSQSQTLQNTGATHGGWALIQALGGRTPATQATGLTTVGPSITLTWNPMISTAGTITSYAIYRSTLQGGQDFTTPLAANISPTVLTYTDLRVVTNTTYYYVVRPQVGTASLSTYSNDTEVKVPVPPANMALVHQWTANLEMCGNLGRSVDRDNDYRCPYTGPINTNGFYDVGQNQFWDVVQLGCNYTPPNTTASLSCNDSTNGCLGTGAPSASVTDGQVYYDRTGQQCYVYVAATPAWVPANQANSTQLKLMISNSPGLPPLVKINRSQSWLACQQFTLAGVGTKRVPKHSEHIVAAAWSPSLTDSVISNAENGISLSTTGFCNSNSGSGLIFDLSAATPSNPETLPGISGQSAAVRTGSTSTKNCISMYGLQDMAGNIDVWNTDQLSQCAGHECTTTSASTIDPSNTDWYSSASLAIHFDGTVAPGGTSDGQAGPDYTSSWTLSSPQFAATQFLVPLGIPLVTSAPSTFDALAIGTGSGQFSPTRFHSNTVQVFTDSISTVRGLIAGGNWTSGSSAGRYTFNLNQGPDATLRTLGVRCMVPIGD